MTKDLLRDWYPLIETQKYQDLLTNLRNEYKEHKVYPSPHDVFKIFQDLPPQNVRVVIIGQDPYPNGHADGYAFSSKEKDTPYSLQRILREVDRDVMKTKNRREFNKAFPRNSLENWVRQGVLLINTVMTVRAGQPGSHKNIGWQEFTQEIITTTFDNSSPKVFVAWGAEAKKITDSLAIRSTANHLILEAGHPASGAHGKDQFSGCSHFSKINRHFHKLNLPTISWKT